MSKDLFGDYKKEFTDKFNQYVKKFFEDNPQVEKFVWRQTTNTWNDGEPCYMSVDFVAFKFAGDDTFDNYFDSDSEHYDPDLDPYDIDYHYVNNEEEKKIIRPIGDAISVNPVVMELIFGTDHTITATRDGYKVEYYDGHY